MRKLIRKFGVALLISMMVVIQVHAEIVKKDDGTIDYEKTPCKEGLTEFIEEKGAEYDEFFNEHMSNPDLSSNLLDTMMDKFNIYSAMIMTEYFKYRARSGATSASQFELLEACYTMVRTEITERKSNLKQNFRAGAVDRKALRLTSKYATVNERFSDRIHFPFSQFLGRMKSFADSLPCYTSKCAK